MNKLQKINKENNQLLLEVESKLDLLVKGQESNSKQVHQVVKTGPHVLTHYHGITVN